MSSYHEPVMGKEVLELMCTAEDGLYLDGTVGGGGHTRMILESSKKCRVIAVDRDPEALDEARKVLADHRSRVRFVSSRFDRAVLDPEIRDRGLDGVLLDLGVSSHQIDSDDRGFTFRRGVKLDMRMDAEGPDATTFLAEASEDELTQVFRDFGDEPRARRLAREIVKRRVKEPLESSDDLVAAMTVSLGHSPSIKKKARIFQSVRIAVNEEIDALETGLPALRDVMKAGGVMTVIAYHSVEDRAVKSAFREWSRACVCPAELPACMCRGHALGETLTRKVIRPTDEEVKRNPRARSARLRAWRRAA